MDEAPAPHVGIDVSKDRLDVHVQPDGRRLAFGRDDAGLDALCVELVATAPALVVLEATGGYEIAVAAALAANGLPVAVVNPRQVRKLLTILNAVIRDQRPWQNA